MDRMHNYNHVPRHVFSGEYDVFRDGRRWNLAFRGMASTKSSIYEAFTKAQDSCVDARCLDVCSLNILTLII